MAENENRFLENPDPKYYLDIGAMCWAATDNAHGGQSFLGRIAGKKLVNGSDIYVFQYTSPDAPGIELTEDVPARNVFTDQKSLEAARCRDRSMQHKAIRDACATKNGLIAFLVNRAGLPETERDIVLEQVQALGLIDTPKGQPDTEGQA